MDAQAALRVSADGYTVAAMVGYLALMVGIGVWASGFASGGVREFFVGGRVMNRVVVALSAVASGRSAWLLLGLSGMAYTLGAPALWAAVGYTLVELLLFLYFAPRLRRFAGVFDCITVTDFFAERFGDDRLLRSLIALIILIFMTGYVAAQFVAGGKAFSVTFGVGLETGVWITAGIVLFYTLFGGFLAVSVSDTVQAAVMLVVLVLLPVTAVAQLGGVGEVAGALRLADAAVLDPFALSAGTLIGFLAIGLGSPGNPHIVVRYMSIDDPEELRFAAGVATIWNVLMAVGAVTIGLLGRAAIPEAATLPGADPENVFPVLAGAYLDPLMLGVAISAVLAAIMSTADSQLLVASSCLVRDLYQKGFRRRDSLSQTWLVFLSRVAVLGLAGVALLVGFMAEEVLFWLVLFAWAGLGASLGPTSILAIFWRGTTKAGVYAGVLAGAATTVIWYYTPALKEQLYELVPGFLAGFVATVVVSRLTLPPHGVGTAFQVMEGRRLR
ncbi:MAG: sodium/proline symporter [Longimicrobiaceae bacterium]